jgi:hypothetical protein
VARDSGDRPVIALCFNGANCGRCDGVRTRHAKHDEERKSKEVIDMAPNEPTSASGNGSSIDPGTGRVRDLEAQVIAQAVQDPAFRARLLAEPKAVFADRGLSIPPEIQIQVLQETAEQYYLVLPAAAARRAGASLSDAELEHVAGGASTVYAGWTGCASGESGCIVTYDARDACGESPGAL